MNNEDFGPVQPCPFCGSDQIQIAGNEYNTLWFECTDCRATGPRASKGWLALDQWNERPQVGELEAELKNANEALAEQFGHKP